LSWSKGSNIPDSYSIGESEYKLYYKVYRGTTNTPGSAGYVTTLAADVKNWTDNTVPPNTQYYYWVTTYTDGFGGKESARTTANALLGKTKALTLTASDGTSTTRVKLDWPSYADFAEEIRVERNDPKVSGGKEELSILSKNATAYNDMDAIPGYNYTYYLLPIKTGRTFTPVTDTGYKSPNGTISGYVKSILNAGVSGVKVTANPVGTLTPGAVNMPAGGYSAITDADGYFEIREIYYFDGAEFNIVPEKSLHVFTPALIVRRLDLNSKSASGINFTDESVYTVGGMITYPQTTITACGVPDVEIKINGESRGVYTKPDGSWRFTIIDEKEYTFKPVFLNHRFENADGLTEQKVFVNSSNLNINFTDKQKDDIIVRVQGGCGEALAEKAYVRVTSPGNCYDEPYETDENGILTITGLPARKYFIEVTGLSPDNYTIFEQIGNGKTIEVDITERKTEEITQTLYDTVIVPGYTRTLPNDSVVVVGPDTTITSTTETIVQEIIPAADFIYHSPLKIVVDFAEAGAIIPGCECEPGQEIMLMEQNVPYNIVFEVLEELGNCPVEQGTLRIFDFISDIGDKPVDIPIENGFAYYTVVPGLPKIAESTTHNHEKLLYVMPRVGFLDSEPYEYWAIVTGVKTYASSFTTRSPELPFLILHDPPGDKSSAFVEEGKVIRNFNTVQYQVGGELGAFANLLVGAKVLTPFSSNAFGTKININIAAGTDEFWKSGFESTITFKEKFSTSDMENLTGDMGDVYIGGSLNQEFSRGDELTFDKENCKVNIETVPTIDLAGFATTFVYTEKHIRYTLIPLLGSLRADVIRGRPESELSEEDKFIANQLQFDSLHWENVIAKNAENRGDKAVFKKNISFSAGAPYSGEYSAEDKWSESFEYNAYVNTDFLLGIKIDNESGIWFDSELGITAKLRFATKGESGTDSTLTRTVGYTLDDGDMGDFFSVDIKEDKAYGVPAFKLLLGTSSCPHEPGTQPRDEAQIEIYPAQINNVPIGGKAVMTAQLINDSQSRETREYSVQVVSTSNPDGALVKLAGESINFKPASFWMDYNQQYDIALTVEKGPFASNYDSIGIMMFPSCEMDLWNDGGDITSGDTAWIFVNFESECSSVSLQLPGNGWMVNQNSNNNLHIAFKGYDLNNKMLESITLQYKREGQGWTDITTITKDMLSGFIYDYNFDVSGLSDGNYRVRAKANCGAEGGFSYSSEQIGIIDRTSLAPFGMPVPSDGYLRLGQEISVTFDKDIDCNFSGYTPVMPEVSVRLYTEDMTEIPVTLQCSETMDKLILVPDDDLFENSQLEGVKLYAEVSGIRDINGNVQKYTTKWSFLVNVSPVAWNPDYVSLTARENDEVIISANLDNSSVISKPFDLNNWPDWLVPSVTSASILPGNSFTIQFKVTPGLTPGFYEGEVIALVDDEPEVLNVSLLLFAQDINWSVNQADFENSMNITALFSYDGGNENLSTGNRDKIAAFINGDLRGTGIVSYIPVIDKYAAFLSVYGNNAGNNCSLLEGQDNVTYQSVQFMTFIDEGISYRGLRFKKSNFAEYKVYATKDYTDILNLRVACVVPATLQVYVDGLLQQTLAIPHTGSLNTFITIQTSLILSKGSHTIKLQSTNGEFDMAYIQFPEYHVRNQNCSEVIKFRMWDGLNGIEYGAVEELSFFSDGMVGSAEQPFLLHPAGGIQDVTLAKGWTWISVNKVSSDMSLPKVFESITAPTSKNTITLKSQTNFSQYSQSSGWLGPLASIDARLGYMIHLNTHPDTLSMVGVDPSEKSLVLNPKWNWIGHPRPGVKAVNDVLEGLYATAGDLLKSQFAFAEYNQGTGKWIGSLSMFQPGRGYKLFVKNASTMDMLKSGSPGDLDKNYEFTMTLTAAVAPQPASDEGLSLMIYIDGKLRGIAPLQYVESLGKMMSFAMIYGDRADVGELVEVVLVDEKQAKSVALVGTDIRFTIDQINGTPANPVVLQIPENWTSVDKPVRKGIFTVYPNPFTRQTHIRYNLLESSHVILSVYNATGAEVVRLIDHKLPAGFQEYLFDAKDLATGIYYFMLQNGREVETQKVILLETR
jgi:trimeric autotransporter adhesin